MAAEIDRSNVEASEEIIDADVPIVVSAGETLQRFRNQRFHNPDTVHENGEVAEQKEGSLILRNAGRTTTWTVDRSSFDITRTNHPSVDSPHDTVTRFMDLLKKMFVRNERNRRGKSDIDVEAGSKATPANNFYPNRSVGHHVQDINPPQIGGYNADAYTLLLALGALGVVFGDIGTSPLYTIQTIFLRIEATPENVVGAISSIFWLLNLTVTLKYVTVIMRADNRGEGGIMALTTLASQSPHGLTRPWWKTMTMMIGESLRAMLLLFVGMLLHVYV